MVELQIGLRMADDATNNLSPDFKPRNTNALFGLNVINGDENFEPPVSSAHLQLNLCESNERGLDTSSKIVIPREIDIFGNCENKKAFTDPYDFQLSWDDLDCVYGNHPEKEVNASLIGLTYSDETITEIRKIVISALHGLNSDVIIWNNDFQVFQVHSRAKSTAFYDYFTRMAEIATCARSLQLRIEHLHEISTLNRLRSVNVFAVAVEHELLITMKPIAELSKTSHLIDLYEKSIAVLERLSLLERITNSYHGVHTLDWSHINTLNASTTPINKSVYSWISQLNFAIGLTQTHIERLLDVSFKTQYFPELFLELTGTDVNILWDSVPKFIPPVVAEMVCKIYFLTTINSINVPSEICPIEIEYSVESHLLEPLYPLTETHATTKYPNNSSGTQRILTTDILLTTRNICQRYSELDLSVKASILAELKGFYDVVVGLYWLNDGCLWSRLSEFVEDVFSTDEITSINALIKMERVVETRFHDICLVLKHSNDTITKQHNDMDDEHATESETNTNEQSEPMKELFIQYEPPSTISRIFGMEFIVLKCQSIFNRILSLYVKRQFQKLTILTLELDTHIKHIRQVLHDENKGLFELIQSFKDAFFEINKV